jgi:hypothetical protein
MCHVSFDVHVPLLLKDIIVQIQEVRQSPNSKYEENKKRHIRVKQLKIEDKRQS